MHDTPMSDMERMLRDDWRLTTAEILYHLPDHPMLLQSYTWQEVDLVPEFPQLKKFLAFWEREIEGRLHSVKVAACDIIKPAGFVNCSAQFKLH